MKNLGKLKLNQLSKVDLEKREMNFLKGGGCCACACAGSYPETTNEATNDSFGYGQSGGGGNCECACCGMEVFEVNNIYAIPQ
jgi:natural product precursor